MGDPPGDPELAAAEELEAVVQSMQALQEELDYQRAQDVVRQLVQRLDLTPRERSHLEQEIAQLTAMQTKLEEQVVHIAVFGMVGRGKSSLLNALLGQEVFTTGAVHGVTRTVQGAAWQVSQDGLRGSDRDLWTVSLPGLGQSRLELLDTPGLDEVGGEAREQLARQVAQQADLILFVVAGDITQVEYQALTQLRQASKPMLLVFNKVDQYPPGDRQAIYETIRDRRVRDLLSPEEIVMAAAAPVVTQATRRADGTLDLRQTRGMPQVDDLKLRILSLLHRDGRSLVALNTLLYADTLNDQLVRRKLEIRDRSAEDIIWSAALTKAMAIALNPVTALDLLGGMAVDLALIGLLSKLYGIPLTEHGALRLLKTIALGMGGIPLSEMLATLGLSSLKGLLGLAAPATGGLALGAYVPVAIAQGSVAGVASYSIGQVAKVYFANGATWNQDSPKAVVQDILQSLDEQSILNRLKAELAAKLTGRPDTHSPDED
jgi:GTP-binding protein Era